MDRTAIAAICSALAELQTAWMRAGMAALSAGLALSAASHAQAEQEPPASPPQLCVQMMLGWAAAMRNGADLAKRIEQPARTTTCGGRSLRRGETVAGEDCPPSYAEGKATENQ